MNSLNSILIEGNLTRDPVVSETPKGTKVCNFSVASNRFYRHNEEMQKEVSFFDVETWSKLADKCADQLEKGRGVRVVGRLRQDRWTDREGQNRSRVKIVAEHVDIRTQFKRDDDEASSDAESEAEAVETMEQSEEREAALVF